jgi:TonB family protein
MKKLHYLGILMLIASVSYTTHAQNQMMNEITITPPMLNSANSDDLTELLQTALEYPVNSRNRGLQGTEVIRFSVSTTGTIEDITVINSVSKEIDREVIRAIQTTSGKWEPGTIDQDPLKMNREVSLLFALYSPDDMLITARKNIRKGNKLMYSRNKPERALRYYNMAYALFPNEKSVMLPRNCCLKRLGYPTYTEKNKPAFMLSDEFFMSLVEPITLLTASTE